MGSGVKYIVQMPRIHSSECQIFINDIRLTGVSQFEISKEREVLDLRGLKSLVVEDRISKNHPKISIGDNVRVMVKENAFEKKYKPRFSKNVFTVNARRGRYFYVQVLHEKSICVHISKRLEMKHN